MRAPILICGAARSGTSLIGGVIEICGAFGGKMFGPHKANPKGMYENAYIREKIVKPYLESTGNNPRCQYPLPDPHNLPLTDNFKELVENAIIADGYKDGEWFYKCPKMVHMWLQWDYAFPDAKWVIVRRKTPDIIKSCTKTGFMTAFHMQQNLTSVGARNPYEGWRWWVREHEKRFTEIATALPHRVIWPERMVYNDYGQIKEMIEWLGLEWREKEVMEFIEPKLWRARN